MKNLIVATLFFAILGLIDASYLTWEHFSNAIPPCSTSVWVDCGKVLDSRYAVMFGVPVAILGVAYYASMIFLSSYRLQLRGTTDAKILLFFQSKIPRWQRTDDMLLELQVLAATAGVTFSIYFVYLQLVVIQAICLYCMISAINSVIIFSIVIWQRFGITKGAI